MRSSSDWTTLSIMRGRHGVRLASRLIKRSRLWPSPPVSPLAPDEDAVHG